MSLNSDLQKPVIGSILITAVVSHSDRKKQSPVEDHPCRGSRMVSGPTLGYRKIATMMFSQIPCLIHNHLVANRGGKDVGDALVCLSVLRRRLQER